MLCEFKFEMEKYGRLRSNGSWHKAMIQLYSDQKRARKCIYILNE